MDDDATRLLPGLSEGDEEHLAGCGPQVEHARSRRPIVGISSVGQTHFGDTSVGFGKCAEMLPSEAFKSRLSGQGHTPRVPRERSAPPRAPKPRRAVWTAAFVGVLAAFGTTLLLAPSEPPLVSNPPPEATKPLALPVDTVQRKPPARAVTLDVLNAEEVQLAKRGILAIADHNCPLALTSYQELVNREGHANGRWDPFLNEARSRCFDAEVSP
jgi:hypothetical protein